MAQSSQNKLSTKDSDSRLNDIRRVRIKGRNLDKIHELIRDSKMNTLANATLIVYSLGQLVIEANAQDFDLPPLPTLRTDLGWDEVPAF